MIITRIDNSYRPQTRHARTVVVQFEDGDAAESNWVPNTVPENRVAEYLERATGRQVVGWTDTGRDSRRDLPGRAD